MVLNLARGDEEGIGENNREWAEKMEKKERLGSQAPGQKTNRELGGHVVKRRNPIMGKEGKGPW